MESLQDTGDVDQLARDQAALISDFALWQVKTEFYGSLTNEQKAN